MGGGFQCGLCRAGRASEGKSERKGKEWKGSLGVQEVRFVCEACVRDALLGRG